MICLPNYNVEIIGQTNVNVSLASKVIIKKLFKSSGETRKDLWILDIN